MDANGIVGEQRRGQVWNDDLKSERSGPEKVCVRIWWVKGEGNDEEQGMLSPGVLLCCYRFVYR